jgi:hypothetical protein
MRIHWSIADQELDIGVEHTGRKVQFEKIRVPFLRIDYFMWGHEDKETLKQRFATKISEEKCLALLVLLMVVSNII